MSKNNLLEEIDIYNNLIFISLINRFEMTLKEMIEEARMMAETPDLDPIRDGEDDGIEETDYHNRRYDRSRAAKSPSEYSYTESVVSVIEKPHMRDSPSMPGIFHLEILSV